MKKDILNDTQKGSINIQESFGTLAIPEPLTSDEISALISEMYTVAGPRIGAIFVEANVVLTVAGARGQTEFFIDNPVPEDFVVIKRLSEVMEQKGIKLQAIDSMQRPNGKPFLMVSIESLRGYELVSRIVKIPGIIPFNSSTGFEGSDTWFQQLSQNLYEKQLSGSIPYPSEEVPHILAGIVKGYPDQAIYDAIDWWTVGESKTPIADSHIKHVTKYGGAYPDFIFHPDHANDVSIKDTIKKWGEILEGFYNHPWHQELSKNPEFIAARLVINDTD